MIEQQILKILSQMMAATNRIEKKQDLIISKGTPVTEFWNVKQAAAKLHMCERSIINHINDGKIKAKRFSGRKWLIDPNQFKN